ncbi:uncharacterized protein B0T15DRAFT_489536 [Chaetomium strumarium]|uniref:Uncharacterized protein n=1 Tax=Chaetomium strumarium TaxID=1170767 RepID=A0AAJ0M6H5_9PEZI|nr:hypothetical protein B0T15DRAFT_489536 [Chaetomium strumarium]
MGCGGSRPEVIEGKDEGRPQRLAPAYHQRPKDGSDQSASETASVAAGFGAASRPHDPQPPGPDDRVNSANHPNQLQYTSPRGNVPLKRLNDIVQSAPAPPKGPPLMGKRFPKRYRNNEGPSDNPTHNYEAWEIQRPQAGGNGALYEYPIKPIQQPAPSTANFNFDLPPASIKRLRPPHPNDKENTVARWKSPPNDPGPLRAVVNEDRAVVGAMYHPEGNIRGYKRARLVPLDRQGRAEVARHDDRQQLGGRTTWPHRGSDNDWQ